MWIEKRISYLGEFWSDKLNGNLLPYFFIRLKGVSGRNFYVKLGFWFDCFTSRLVSSLLLGLSLTEERNGEKNEIKIWWLTKENWNFICYLKFFSIVTSLNKIFLRFFSSFLCCFLQIFRGIKQNRGVVLRRQKVNECHVRLFSKQIKDQSINSTQQETGKRCDDLMPKCFFKSFFDSQSELHENSLTLI